MGDARRVNRWSNQALGLCLVARQQGWWCNRGFWPKLVETRRYGIFLLQATWGFQQPLALMGNTRGSMDARSTGRISSAGGSYMGINLNAWGRRHSSRFWSERSWEDFGRSLCGEEICLISKGRREDCCNQVFLARTRSSSCGCIESAIVIRYLVLRSHNPVHCEVERFACIELIQGDDSGIVFVRIDCERGFT